MRFSSCVVCWDEKGLACCRYRNHTSRRFCGNGVASRGFSGCDFGAFAFVARPWHLLHQIKAHPEIMVSSAW
ncbi:MAG: hypothetical protein ACKN9T_05695 [Candidatus Methylumidiphilus sp.]